MEVENNRELAWDLAVLQQMAEQMEPYLKSESLFWPMDHTNMPRLTLGAYWLRQYRLTMLHTLLTTVQKKQLVVAIEKYDSAVSDWVVRTEQRAHTELEARIRQWSEYLNDVQAGKQTDITGYPAQVETRAIIAALVNRLQHPPYMLDEAHLPRLVQLDKALRTRWQSGEFIWPEAWQPAYPKPEFWWLYGRPK